ncbi:MAG: TetR/AcrR family transcriptional regulator [Acidimicrobiales bacterium]
MDARVARSRAAVLAAATDLLVEGGPGAVTVDAVVARSGVAKTTIYRHWDSRDDLLVAVIECSAPDLPPPSEDASFEQALRDVVAYVVADLSDPRWQRMLPALLMLKHHEAGIAEIAAGVNRRQTDALEVVLERGRHEGAVADHVTSDIAAAQLFGPLLFALLTDMVPLDSRLADAVVDGFLAAARPG